MSLGTPAHKTAFTDATNLKTFGPSPAFTADAGDFVLVTVASYAGLAQVSEPLAVTDSVGLHWARVTGYPAIAGNAPTLSIWAARLAAAFTGTVSVQFPATARGVLVSVDVIPGASPSAPVRLDNTTVAGGTGTGIVVVLPKPIAAATHLHLCAVVHQKNEATVAGGGFTPLVDLGLTDAGVENRLSVQVKANDVSCDPSWATASAYLALGIEIQEILVAARDTQLRWQPAALVEVDLLS